MPDWAVAAEGASAAARAELATRARAMRRVMVRFRVGWCGVPGAPAGGRKGDKLRVAVLAVQIGSPVQNAGFASALTVECPPYSRGNAPTGSTLQAQRAGK